MSLSKELQRQRQEWALGKKLADDVDRHVDLITEVGIIQYLNRLERNILNGSGLSGCFVVKVLIDPEPNAYSLPGGFIYVTTGLLDGVETEGQLVSALAHETAHVTARHFTRVETQNRIWGRLALIGGPPGYALRRLLGPLLLFSLVRKTEFEADRQGLRYLTAAGYKWTELCSLLQNVFPDEEGRAFLNHLYDTHPATNERIRRLRASGRTVQLTRTGYIVNQDEFAKMKMRFAVMMAAERNP